MTSFDTYMQGQAALCHFNGNVLVAKKGNIIYEKSFGFADYDTKRKLERNSIFDCGSIAKQFTAMGILILKDKGKLNYSDTLRKFFPELPYHNVTIHQLLTHTSGMANGFALVSKFFDHSKIASNDDLMRLLARERPPLLFKPGENMSYSGTAFNLLASIIEKISGQPFKVYMEEQVFKPLGMTNTTVANGPRSAENIKGYAYGYVYSDSLKKYQWAENLQSGWTTYLAGITGEGMIISTAPDLLKWDRALKTHSLLTETTQREMVSAQAEKAVPGLYFGYGVRVGHNDLGNYIFHNGYYPGYLSMLIRYVDEDVTTIVLSNNESRADYIADALSAIALNKNIVFPNDHKEAPVSVIPDKYCGKYMMSRVQPPYMVTFPVEFIKKDGRLYIHPGMGNDIELKPESENKFFFGDGTDQQVEFQTDNGGGPVKVWHIAWGLKRELKNLN